MKLKEIAGMIGLTLIMRRQNSKQPNQERGVIDGRLRPEFARMQRNSELLGILKQQREDSQTSDGVLLREPSNIVDISENPRFARKKLTHPDNP